MTPLRRLSLLGLLLVLAWTGAGCASFRATWRGFRNEDMTGRTAPEWISTEWIGPAEAEVDAAAWAKRWRLVVFFLPG